MKAQSTLDSALFASVFPRVMTKAERRQMQILDAAIECYASLGIERTTYEKIAEKCAVSRPLIIHYFPDRESLVEVAVKYIRANMQQFAIDTLRKGTDPEAQLRLYVQSVFDWVKRFDSHQKVWLLFYYYAGINEHFKAIHSELTKMGHERIMALVKQLRGTKALSEKELLNRAKTMQTLIAGGMLAAQTENALISAKDIAHNTAEWCVKIALA